VVNVKQLRERLGLTQTQFARRYGLSVYAIQHWERGSRQPRAAAKLLLRVIERHPDLVADVLKKKG
jgi:putative transcriptional regulator